MNVPDEFQDPTWDRKAESEWLREMVAEGERLWGLAPESVDLRSEVHAMWLLRDMHAQGDQLFSAAIEECLDRARKVVRSMGITYSEVK